MKECLLDNCAGYHEGYCCIDAIWGIIPEDCKAKTDDDLITEDEWIEQNTVAQGAVIPAQPKIWR